jgi:hypothetical protein
MIRSGDAAINEFPETVYILSASQNARVIQPTIPEVTAPRLAPLNTKNREKPIVRHHNPLETSQFNWNTSALASSI